MTALAPVFSLVTALDGPALAVVKDMTASVAAQDYERFEWIVVVDGPTRPEATAVLRAAAADPRVTLIERTDREGPVAALNEATDRATGAFVAFLDQGDVLAPHALRHLVWDAETDVDVLYTDEDTTDGTGRFTDRFNKPDWSPERLLGQSYLSHLLVVRRELVRAVGGFRPEFADAAAYDLALRVTELARSVVHVPEPLCHRWQGSGAVSDADAHVAGRRAVADAILRRGMDAEVTDDGDYLGHHRIVRRLDPAVRVSLVIPTMGSRAIVWGTEQVLVVEAVRSALARTAHPHVEVVVVYDDHMDPAVLDQLRDVAGERLVAVEYTKRFNFSEKINVGALQSSGDVIVLLNDDVRVRTDGWLEQLVAPLADENVGMTGAKLFFADGTLQHGGHTYRDGGWGHPYFGWDGDSAGLFRALRINREVSGVTAACAAIRRQTFFEVGGLTEILPVNYNDVDLCYKVRHRGYRIVFLAGCELYHFESKSREPGTIHPWERRELLKRWDLPERDPYMPDRTS